MSDVFISTALSSRSLTVADLKKKVFKKGGFLLFLFISSSRHHMRTRKIKSSRGTGKVNTGSPLLSGLHFILCYVVELVGATDRDEEACSSQLEISEEKPDQRALSP